MAKRSREWNETKLNTYISIERRGQGEGKDYKPWIQVQDFPSKGRCSRVKGIKTGRVHNFMSDIETRYFYLLEYDEANKITDIREFYPLLDFDDMVQDKNDLRTDLFIDKSSGCPYIITTAFLITCKVNNEKVRYFARSVIASKSLERKSTLEKLEMERRYWSAKEIDWAIVTEKDINITKSKNIEWVLPSIYTFPDIGLSQNDVIDMATALRFRLEGNKKPIRSMIMNLGITVKNTPPYRGDWKPLVERHFKLTNERTKPFLPGAINPDFRERGGKDYRLDAKLDIMQFTQIIIKCVLFHNNQYQLNHFNRDELMVADEVPLIPREIWNWGIANKMGRLRQMDEEVVKLNLMPTDEGTVTTKGIRFKGLFYSSKASMKEQWFIKARSRGSWKIPVCYDPRNINYIYIKKTATEFEKCYLLEYLSVYKDKYIEEVEYLMEWEKIQKAVGKDDELQAKTDLISDIESIVKEAKSQTNKELILSDESDTQRTKNIRENRHKEKLLNREKDLFELDKHVRENTAEVISFKEQDPENDIMRLLRQKQREAFDRGRSK